MLQHRLVPQKHWIRSYVKIMGCGKARPAWEEHAPGCTHAGLIHAHLVLFPEVGVVRVVPPVHVQRLILITCMHADPSLRLLPQHRAALLRWYEGQRAAAPPAMPRRSCSIAAWRGSVARRPAEGAIPRRANIAQQVHRRQPRRAPLEPGKLARDRTAHRCGAVIHVWESVGSV